MTWLLILSIAGGDTVVRVPYGYMFNPTACAFAGNAVAQELMHRVDGVTVTFTCIAQGET
jgi:hypothetical protein